MFNILSIVSRLYYNIVGITITKYNVIMQSLVYLLVCIVPTNMLKYYYIINIIICIKIFC